MVSPKFLYLVPTVKSQQRSSSGFPSFQSELVLVFLCAEQRQFKHRGLGATQLPACLPPEGAWDGAGGAAGTSHRGVPSHP